MSDVQRTDEIQGDIVHEYDGIEEADNRLPNWWLATFYLTVVFSIGYWFYYHVYESGLSPKEAYAAVIADEQTEHEEVTATMLNVLAADSTAVAEGKEVFSANCVACHEAQGQGKIGPNLTDAFWVHGGSATDIYKMVDKGFPAKGMPAWGPVLGVDKAKRVVAYVLTLRNTDVEGKAPEGEKWSGDVANGDMPEASNESTGQQGDEAMNGTDEKPVTAEPGSIERKAAAMEEKANKRLPTTTKEEANTP